VTSIEIVPGVYRFPTPKREADGTLSWTATTAVTCTARAAGQIGLGWTYSSPAAATIIGEQLAEAVSADDVDGVDVAGAFVRMRRACRNLGTRGLVMQAISAVDIALWDLRARQLGAPLTVLLGGSTSDSVPVYGSGGFTTLSEEELAGQVDSWLSAGCSAVKIKIGQDWGRHEDRDLARVTGLVDLVGPEIACMVDANGGYGRAQARRVGAALDSLGVSWFEEPVSSDDLAGLRTIAGAVRCDVAAGEYISEPQEAAALCRSVDCLQLDVTRCGGYTGWLRCAAVAGAAHVDLSAHCAPSLHAPLAGAVEHLRHLEWFIDHARLEPQLVDGVPEVRDGRLCATGAAGHGMSLSERADHFRVT
jgi:L-alanine-DL-glutamate epimerase-like enolase superfamily enzyme